MNDVTSHKLLGNTAEREEPTSASFASGRVVSLALACIAIIADLWIAYNAHSLIVFSLCYALGTVCSLILFARAFERRSGLPPNTFAVALLLGAILRIILVFKGPLLSFDALWYRDYVTFIAHGQVPYRDFFFPYPQGFGLVLNLLRWSPVEPQVVLRAIFVLSDLGTLWVLYSLWGKNLGRGAAANAALAYAVLPLPLLESARIGHYETLICLACAICVAGIIKSKTRVVAVMLAAATMLKAFPAVILPAAVATWRSRPRIVLSLTVVALVCFVATLPFMHVLKDVLGFWVGVSGQQGSATSQNSFVANSLIALVRDFVFLQPVVIAGEAALLLLIGMMLVQSLAIAASAEGTPQDVSSFALAYRPIAAMRIRLVGRKWSPILRMRGNSTAFAHFSWAVFFVGMLLLGIHACVAPWLKSLQDVPWWTPTPMLIGRGAAVVLCAILGLMLIRRETVRDGAHALTVIMGCTIWLVVVLHANVNPWYLFPAVVLFLCAMPSRLALIAVACIAFFYPTSNSSMFTVVGVDDASQVRHDWRITTDAGPDNGVAIDPISSGAVVVGGIRYNRYAVTRSSQRQYVLVDARACKLKLPPAFGTFGGESQEVSLSGEQSVIADIPAGESGGVSVPSTSCRLRVTKHPELKLPLGIAQVADGVVIRARGTSGGSGWVPLASASMTPVNHTRGGALTFTVQSDVDPTFHQAPFRLTILGDGTGLNGEALHAVAFTRDNTQATNLGPITFRVSLASVGVASLHKVTIVAYRSFTDGRIHEIKVSRVGVVPQDVWDKDVALQSAAIIAIELFLFALAIYYWTGRRHYSAKVTA